MNAFTHNLVAENPAADAAGSAASHPLLPRAADMKAAGASWDAVSSELDIPVDELREWPRVYRAGWKAEYRFAAEQVVGECVAESLHTLRRHLRDDETKISLTAAGLLAKMQMTTTRHQGGAKAEAADDPWAGIDMVAYRSAERLTNMTHDEGEKTIDEIVEQRERRKKWPAEDAAWKAAWALRENEQNPGPDDAGDEPGVGPGPDAPDPPASPGSGGGVARIEGGDGDGAGRDPPASPSGCDIPKMLPPRPPHVCRDRSGYRPVPEGSPGRVRAVPLGDGRTPVLPHGTT